MLSPHAKSEWTTLFVIGLLLSATAVLAGWWWLSIPVMIASFGLMLFFRDPDRPIPTQRGIMVAPADGKVSSIHQVEFFEPFNGPATCIRIFLSVFDVHINRSPIHGVITSITHKPGEHLNVLNPQSAEVNEYNLLVFTHPIRRDPVAAVRQVAGLCARTICCTVHTGEVIQRGQRIGLIKLGSTTELYIPDRFDPQVLVEQGQYVYGGTTILANVNMGPAHENQTDSEEEQENQNPPIAARELSDSPNDTQPPPVTDDTSSKNLCDQVELEDEELQEDEQATDVMDAVNDESANTVSEDQTEPEIQEQVNEAEVSTDDSEDDSESEDQCDDSDNDMLNEDGVENHILENDEISGEDAEDESENQDNAENQIEEEAHPPVAKSPSPKKSDDQTPMLF